MRALTLWQPHAGLIVLGHKLIETRGWRTDHRGELAIHAGQRFDEEYWRAAIEEEIVPFEYWAERPEDCDRRGAIICVAELVDCRPMKPDDERLACCSYRAAAFAWVLANVRRVDPPIFCPGQRGLWNSEAGSVERASGFATKPKASQKKGGPQICLPGVEE